MPSAAKSTLITAGALAFLVGILPAADEAWTTDFAAAKAKAAKEKKHLLLEFSGSDWCFPCKMLNGQVFSKEAFQKEAVKNFVLVELDFPRFKELPAKVVQQNRKLQREYRVSAYPTVLLTDSDGKVYARTGFRPGGPENYVKHINELRSNKVRAEELFTQAEKAEGLKKAELLDRALATLENNGMEGGHESVIEEIKKLDSEGKGGFLVKYEAREKLRSDPDGAVKLIDEYVEEHSPGGEVKQELLYLKAIALHFKQDKTGRDEALKAALEAAPEAARGKQIEQIIENLKGTG